jgi:prepilin-type N-terminal cleavage/methylation domain-containing protein/prepilin-type processing-associated H-X9-DG protein
MLTTHVEPVRRNGNHSATPRHCGAFSLIELLLVLTIVLILTSLALTGGPERRKRQEMAACRNNLLAIHQALGAFALDHTGAYPSAKTDRSEVALSQLVPRCTTRTEIFICPGASLRKLPQSEPFADRRIAYSYAMGVSRDAGPDQWLVADEQVGTAPKLVGAALFSASGKGLGANHGNRGGNLVFADGHTDFSPAASAFPITVPPGGTILNP